MSKPDQDEPNTDAKLTPGKPTVVISPDPPPKDDPLLNEAEAVIDGNPRADFPALMTKDAPGG